MPRRPGLLRGEAARSCSRAGTRPRLALAGARPSSVIDPTVAAARTRAARARPRADRAAVEVVVHDPDRLHERVHRGRADEGEAALRRSFDSATDAGVVAIAAERAHVIRRGRAAGAGSKPHTYAASEPCSSTSSSARRAFAIADSILPRWRTMPASPRRRADVARPEPRHRLEIEPGERAAERLPLAEDCEPRQPGLEPLEANLLEQPHVVRDREAPLLVVVADVLRGRTPPSGNEACDSGPVTSPVGAVSGTAAFHSAPSGARRPLRERARSAAARPARLRCGKTAHEDVRARDRPLRGARVPEGVLSAVGHDLLLRATAFEIAVETGAPRVSARLDAASLRVVTAMRERPRASGRPLAADIREIEASIVESVLSARRFPEIRFVSSSVTERTTGTR